MAAEVTAKYEAFVITLVKYNSDYGRRDDAPAVNYVWGKEMKSGGEVISCKFRKFNVLAGQKVNGFPSSKRKSWNLMGGVSGGVHQNTGKVQI